MGRESAHGTETLLCLRLFWRPPHEHDALLVTAPLDFDADLEGFTRDPRTDVLLHSAGWLGRLIKEDNFSREEGNVGRRSRR